MKKIGFVEWKFLIYNDSKDFWNWIEKSNLRFVIDLDHGEIWKTF